MLMVSNLICQALGVVATIRIARILMPHRYGIYGLVQTIASLGVVFAGIGLRNVAIRECARHPEESTRIFNKTLVVRIFSLIIIGIGILLYAQFGHSPINFTLSVSAIVLLIGLSCWELVENIAFGQERMEYSAIINLLGSILWVGMVCSVPAHWFNPVNVSFAFAFLQIIKAVGYLIGLYHVGLLFSNSPTTTSGNLSYQNLLKQSLPFYWLAILTSFITQLPILFLVKRSGEAEVGLYNAGFRLVNPMQLALSTALMALYPGLAQAGLNNPNKFMSMLRRSLYSITILGTIGAMLISLFRKEVVLLLFGHAYLPAGDAMAYQCWYLALLGIYSVIGTNLAARDKQKLLAGLSTCYAILAIPVLWWGAGKGATGLAMAIVMAAIVNMPYHWIFFQKTLPQSLSSGLILRLCIILGIGMFISMIIPQNFPLIWRAVLGIGLLGFLGFRIRKEILTRVFSPPLEKEKPKWIFSEQ